VADYPVPRAVGDEDAFVWDEAEFPAVNYARLGARLAACGNLYRRPVYAGGLLFATPGANTCPVIINQSSRLAANLSDCVRVRVIGTGHRTGNRVPASHLNTMLLSEKFLEQFPPVDDVVRRAYYLPDFAIFRPGYNDGGPGLRFLFVGQEARIERNHDAVRRFLDVMAFESEADRTNAVGAALTVLLRHLWPGAKPLIAVTSTKSHGGKDTVIDFACGLTPKVSISHETTDWAVEKVFVRIVKHRPAVGVVCLENVRVNGHQATIASAFVERFLTDPRPQLHAVGTGEPITIDNHLVVAVSANLGRLSEDLMNRALPIHLTPVGNVADRDTPIGNPRLEYLPAHGDQIEAELHGMVQKWKDEGMPPDEDVRHPMTGWARTIGGILKVNGFTGFLANYASRSRTTSSRFSPSRAGTG
jgi:hypothetical protein